MLIPERVNRVVYGVYPTEIDDVRKWSKTILLMNFVNFIEFDKIIISIVLLFVNISLFHKNMVTILIKRKKCTFENVFLTW